MLIKPSPSNFPKKMMLSNHKEFWRTLTKYASLAIPESKNWMGAQFLSHYVTILDINIIFSLMSNLEKILNYDHNYSDIIMPISNIFVTFIIKRLINGIHKCFKNSLL